MIVFAKLLIEIDKIPNPASMHCMNSITLM